ncbi:TPA: MFS transporter [Klebsiella pneumoniae]|uniref:MFS transporter n=1 Tax=Klebsiella pneumoniae TaxID=573 RepID=UPI000A2724D6|nr:MFS transporter [Klebsiella pneumoniae]MCP5795074.1 MFS transporter [Klebsiella pneumoniae]HDE1650265.1 MFS transporter [Klebsiella pneumoniae]HDE2609885.1 MFS transporter [Klebsiella pneumoniae]
MTYRHRVATVFLFGFFLDLINMFIASIAFPAISRALAVSVSQLAWVSNAYILGLTVVVPFSAWLSERWGAKRLFLLSLGLFSLGGLLIPLGQALTWPLFQPHERAKLSAAVMLVGLLAPACSPAIGGLLVEAFSWRWVFFASLPVALLTFVLAVRWLNDTPGPVRPTRFLPLSLLADPLLRFAMLIYLCVPGMFIGVNVVGMYYLQRVTGMAPGAIGALMVPWSLASFAAITFTGRYFNRFGPRPLVVIGCLLQAMGIMLLLKIDADSPLALLILAFTLMGGGGSLCSSTAQSSAFLHTPAEEMPDASALWNLNRQLSFFAGSALLALLLRVFPPAYAWQGVFISAAVITLLPLLFCLRLNNRAIIHRLHTTLEKS